MDSTAKGGAMIETIVICWLTALSLWMVFWATIDWQGSSRAFKEIKEIRNKAESARSYASLAQSTANSTRNLVNRASDNGLARYNEVIERIVSLERALKLEYQKSDPGPIRWFPRHIKKGRKK